MVLLYEVAKTKKIRQFFLDGQKISINHIEVFANILRKEGLPAATTWDIAVMNITESPFSEKLMMFHINALNATGVANYGTALSLSMRQDLHVLYPKLIAEVGSYTKEGIKMMIDNSWIEQPPQIVHRDGLVKV